MLKADGRRKGERVTRAARAPLWEQSIHIRSTHLENHSLATELLRCLLGAGCHCAVMDGRGGAGAFGQDDLWSPLQLNLVHAGQRCRIRPTAAEATTNQDFSSFLFNGFCKTAKSQMKWALEKQRNYINTVIMIAIALMKRNKWCMPASVRVCWSQGRGAYWEGLFPNSQGAQPVICCLVSNPII